MRPLTADQLGTIKDLAGMKLQVAWMGIEFVTEHPVLWVNDVKRSFAMVVYPDGSGEPPEHMVRAVSEEEMNGLRERDADILLSIPVVEPTIERLKEVWHHA